MTIGCTIRMSSRRGLHKTASHVFSPTACYLPVESGVSMGERRYARSMRPYLGQNAKNIAERKAKSCSRSDIAAETCRAKCLNAPFSQSFRVSMTRLPRAGVAVRALPCIGSPQCDKARWSSSRRIPKHLIRVRRPTLHDRTIDQGILCSCRRRHERFHVSLFLLAPHCWAPARQK